MSFFLWARAQAESDAPPRKWGRPITHESASRLRCLEKTVRKVVWFQIGGWRIRTVVVLYFMAPPHWGLRKNMKFLSQDSPIRTAIRERDLSITKQKYQLLNCVSQLGKWKVATIITAYNHHTMRYWDSGCRAPRILNLYGTEWLPSRSDRYN